MTSLWHVVIDLECTIAQLIADSHLTLMPGVRVIFSVMKKTLLLGFCRAPVGGKYSYYDHGLQKSNGYIFALFRALLPVAPAGSFCALFSRLSSCGYLVGWYTINTYFIYAISYWTQSYRVFLHTGGGRFSHQMVD